MGDANKLKVNADFSAALAGLQHACVRIRVLVLGQSRPRGTLNHLTVCLQVHSQVLRL
jgi:hypothetical protein